MPYDLSPTELLPQLLYRVEQQQARFATWRMTEGHEALAMFTTLDAAAAYRADLSSADGWTVYQPPREKLIEVLSASRDAGILYAALDPLGGTAKTLFDIPRVLASAAAPNSEL